jgi:ubiquinone/menaquinone biosynthesis C-methylase UbiE
MDVDSLNRRFYSQPETVRDYARFSLVWPEEEFIFDRYRKWIHGKAVLDIGCGGGRTTRILAGWAACYTGLDYSEEMVRSCRRKWTQLTFVHGEASDMHMLRENEFDFVLFSFNGIDSMSHEKRVRALKEVHRVLKPGGVFAFSSHNRDDKRIVTAFNGRDLNLMNNLRNIRSYLRVRKYQVSTTAYAILSDPLVGFGYLTYYSRKADQVRQLENAGFQDITIINRAADVVDAESVDRKSQWFHYVCSKAAEGAEKRQERSPDKVTLLPGEAS